MSYMNEVSALIAMFLMALVLRGLGPYVRIRPNLNKYDLMRLSVFMVSALAVSRMFWWDLLRPFLGTVGVMPPADQNIWWELLNTGFNIWAAMAALAALAALHRSLPASEREYYNWLTAPFFPGRLFGRGIAE
jgi:hypothetical protein